MEHPRAEPAVEHPRAEAKAAPEAPAVAEGAGRRCLFRGRTPAPAVARRRAPAGFALRSAEARVAGFPFLVVVMMMLLVHTANLPLSVAHPGAT